MWLLFAICVILVVAESANTDSVINDNDYYLRPINKLKLDFDIIKLPMGVLAVSKPYNTSK